MTMLKIDLSPQVLKIEDSAQKRSCLIQQTTVNDTIIEKELWFLYPTELSLPEDHNCDSYLLAVLLPAMQMKANIIVHGSVSSELLANLTELQHVWKKWCPEQFFLVDIEVERVREKEGRVEGSILAFSGGADAQFSAYRHATGKVRYGTQLLKAGIFIHGFDISISDKKGFSGAQCLANRALKDLQLSLFIVRTNIRELWDINWENYFGSALASVLCAFSKYAGTGLIASGPSYNELFTPMGDHPMLDPMLSSGEFKIMHDGCGFDRSEKIKIISRWSSGVSNLRVCWEGAESNRNCGRCEKCVRTRLNFLVAGISDPVCFSSPLNKEILKNMRLSSSFIVLEWERICDEMIAVGIDDKWVEQVQKVIKRGPPLAFLFPEGSGRRMWVKKMLMRNK
jgi:hypothetical protein